LSGVTGKHYRLLSEAEWEYAARAGSNSRYYFGDDGSAAQYAWCCGDSDTQTHPVGQKKANAFGLYDMVGNVDQWLEDVYHGSYEGAPNDGSAWIESGGGREVRGGSWLGIKEDLRSALRSSVSLESRAAILGFRVARTLTL
jgi:eukaryotic-like serine/threonine-protein kinase